MGPNAYQIIAALGLNHPSLYTPNELRALDPNLGVFVRGSKSNPRLNQRYRVADLLNWTEFPELLSRGELTTIERSPSVQYGGATITNQQGQTYLEIAVGHTSGLLQHGYCAARFLFRATEGDFIQSRFEHQYDQIRQDFGRLTSLAVGVRDNSKLTLIASAVQSLLAKSIPKPDLNATIMTEWIYSNEYGVEFVDYKCAQSFAWAHEPTRIFLQRPIVIENTIDADEDVELCMIRDYCSSFREVPQPHHFIARVQNEALLSHFFTYTVASSRIIELV